MNTKAEKWARIFRAEGGQWPEDGHWPEQWYAIEREMNRSRDVANSGGAGYENEKNEGGDLGTPYVFIDNSGFLLSGGDDQAFPAIRMFSEAEVAALQGVWDRAAAIFNGAHEVAWLEEHVAKAESAKMNTKYDDALSQNPGRIIVVRCNTCGVDYDVRFVSNEVQHKGANHVMSFDCPKGHHSQARRVWAFTAEAWEQSQAGKGVQNE
jgi:hypothetical protein